METCRCSSFPSSSYRRCSSSPSPSHRRPASPSWRPARAVPAHRVVTSATCRRSSRAAGAVRSALGNARSVFENSTVADAPGDGVPFGIATVPRQGTHYAEEESQDYVSQIKKMFQSMGLGEISVSPYDTAWIAMVPSLNGSSIPQFPKCLSWIINNQLLDGSWGNEECIFLAYDRVSNTLACLNALKTWNIGHSNIKKGVDFIRKSLHKLDEEVDDYMPTAFEIVFPSMLDDAKQLGIDLPYDSPIVSRIRKHGKRKLNRIPMETIHTRPTPLLHSLEGLHKYVNWQRILKFMAKNGSFLFSPAATACALKYTGDQRCLQYLNNVLEKFNDAAPSVYPVDLFEHLWMVDRLERLGISRYFKREIKDSLDYVYKFWTSKGIAWARDSNVFDADDTAMAFRLFRLHGYLVSPEVFHTFKQGNEFFCFEGQATQAITGIHNLCRASQIAFPGETILEDLKEYTETYLKERQLTGTVQDKWVISNGLKDEVSYTLNYPWYRSLQRIESRSFIEHYGVNDAWIAKSLYKMPYVNNKIFLKLAKADYNLCQSFHQHELAQVLKWNKESKFHKLGFARQRAFECFFSISATLFEPEYSFARIVWAISGVLTTIIDDFFDKKGTLQELNQFVLAIKSWEPTVTQGLSEHMEILFMGLYNTMTMINQEAHLAQGRDVMHFLRDIWVRYIESIYCEAQWRFSNQCPSLTTYINNAKTSMALEPILMPTLLFLGERISSEELLNEKYSHIMDLVNTIGRFNNDIRGFEREIEEGKRSCVSIFLKENPNATMMEGIYHFKSLSDKAMKELIKLSLCDRTLSNQSKFLHLHMAKILNLFYSHVDGFTSTFAVKQHVNNTLLEPIL